MTFFTDLGFNPSATGQDGTGTTRTLTPDNPTTSTPSFTQPSVQESIPPNLGGNWQNGGGSTTSQPSTTSANAPAGDTSAPLTINNIQPTSSDSQASSATTTASGDTTSAVGSASSTSAPSGGGILDNPLNPFGAPTYHFRFFVTGDKESGGTEVTIAESGKTGFNIKDVKMNAYIGPNPTTRNSVQTSVSITVVETMGTSFLDGLVVAHQRAGTINYQKAFYWLELYFLGYKETGEVQNPITEGMPSNGKWKWKLVISNIDTHLNEGGATYTLQCVILHDSALEQEWLKTSEPYKIYSKKVGDFFTKLAGMLNKSVVKNYQDQLVTYSFKLHSYAGMPSPEGFELVQTAANALDSHANRSMNEDERDTWMANIIRGQNLTEIIEGVISVTEKGRNLAIWGKEDNADKNALPDGKFRTGVFYRCYPQVTFGDFSPATGNYKKNIVFHIKPFRSLATQLHPKESAKTNAAEAVKIATPATRKRYDYIFTGLNTEVINFDIKFNTAWQAALPRFGGWEYYNDMTQTHAMYDKEAAQALEKFRQQQSTAQNAVSSLGQANNALSSGMLNIEGTNVLTKGLEGILGMQKTDAQKTLDGANTSANDLYKQIQAQNQAYSPLGANGTNFVEDDLSYKQALETYISFAQSAEGARRATGAGMRGPHGSRGRSVYGALLEQLYDPAMFQVIDLTVRGDPFWLGDAYDTIFGDSPPGQNAPDPAAGDIFFTLIFKYPSGVHEDSGTVEFRNEQTYTGLYRCASVESIFTDGMFTQILHGTRMAKVDADSAIAMGGGAQAGAAGAGTAGATGTGTTPTTTGSITSNNTTQSTVPVVNSPLTIGTTMGSVPSFVQSGSSFPTSFPTLSLGGAGGA